MGNSPSAAPIPAARGTCRLFGSASFYDTPGRLSPIRTGLLFRLFGAFWLVAGGIGRPKVGTAFPREPLRLAVTPGRDPGMIPGGQHVRNRTALPELGARELRVFEQPPGKAFFLSRRLLAHHAGQQPDAGIDESHGRDLSAREHVVADRHLLEIAAFDQPLIDALETTAQDDGAGSLRQLRDPLLLQWHATGAHQQARARVALR